MCSQAKILFSWYYVKADFSFWKCFRLESDIKRLKADLQSSRNCEQELRSQINNLMSGDKATKSELYQLRQDNESLQQK